MLTPLVFRSHSASATFSPISGGVVVVTLRGLATPAFVASAQDFQAQQGLHNIRAMALDISGAALVFGLDDMQSAEQRARESWPMPIAIVASAQQVADMRAHALRMAAAGVVRRVFNDLLLAVEWAQIEAAPDSGFGRLHHQQPRVVS